MREALEQKIRDKSAVVGVIGLGYVGLPLLNAFIKAGFKTIGFDIDHKKVETLRQGQSYIKHIPAEMIGQWLTSKQFTPTADMSRLREADCILICVPTPLNESRDPDMTYIEGTTEAIRAALRPGQLVVLESTTYPTTTRDVVLPILSKTGLKSAT